MKRNYTVAAIAAIFLIISSATAQTKETLTNKSIIDLTKASLGKDIIISQIQSSACKFDVTTNGIIALKKAGVQEEVISAMMNTNGNKTETVSKQTNSGGSTTKNEVKGSALNIELMNHVYIYNKAQQSSKPLEKSVAGLRTKQGMFGGAVMLQVDGDKSSIRLSQTDAVVFLINTGSAASPELILYKLKSGKNRREVASMKANSFSGLKTGEDVIPIDIVKMKEGVYQITPNKQLVKGEYFFTTKAVAGANSLDAFTFGLD